jgi:hypothetical protein
MSRHTITVEEVDTYLNQETWDQVAASFGSGSQKKLERNSLTGDFRVKDHDAMKFHGPDLEAAVEAYNAAP